MKNQNKTSMGNNSEPDGKPLVGRGAFVIAKHIFAGLIICFTALGMVSFIVYVFYINPIKHIKTNSIWEILLAILLLSIFYFIVFLVVKYFLKLIEWAADVLG